MRNREPRMRTMHDARKAPPHPAVTFSPRAELQRTSLGRDGAPDRAVDASKKKKKARLQEAAARAFPCAFPVVCVCGRRGNVRVAVVLRDRRILRCAFNGLDLGLFLLSYESATRSSSSLAFALLLLCSFR